MAQIVETPEKVVVVTGPSFSQGVKFILFGAVLGAGATFYFLDKKRAKKPFSPFKKAQNEAAEVVDELESQASSLLSRLKVLGERARDVALVAGENLKPALDRAVEEGKKAAAEVQAKLKKELEDAGDKPHFADAEGLPSQKEEKFVE